MIIETTNVTLPSDLKYEMEVENPQDGVEYEILFRVSGKEFLCRCDTTGQKGLNAYYENNTIHCFIPGGSFPRPGILEYAICTITTDLHAPENKFNLWEPYKQALDENKPIQYIRL